MKRTALTAAFLIVTTVILSVGGRLPLTARAKNQNEKSPKIQVSSNKIANGDVLLLQITADNLKSPVANLQINFNQRNYRVYPHPVKGDGAYFALVGIPYRTKPGAKTLTLKFSDPNGYHTRQIPFDVVGGKYKTDVLKVDSRRVNPNKKDSQRAQREHQEVKHIYASASKERLWAGSFQLPAENEISSQFGNRRVFNGKLKSYHNGLDFRSPKGTPAYSANSGIVRMAKNLFYSGNAVILDHGTGIFTIYAHLSAIKTAAGRRVAKGQLIGLTGATGRVSGPHLHWGIKINGTAVNPLQFVEVIDGLIQQKEKSKQNHAIPAPYLIHSTGHINLESPNLA
jgi:murein DD-endopeptidase MepM/ murein hydrolase activator NlpD